MMLLSDFITLSAEEKIAILLHDGTVVAVRRTPNAICYLFQMELFYVETCYPPDGSSVTDFRCFYDTAPLEPYLADISIDQLLERDL